MAEVKEIQETERRKHVELTCALGTDGTQERNGKKVCLLSWCAVVCELVSSSVVHVRRVVCVCDMFMICLVFAVLSLVVLAIDGRPHHKLIKTTRPFSSHGSV